MFMREPSNRNRTNISGIKIRRANHYTIEGFLRLNCMTARRNLKLYT